MSSFRFRLRAFGAVAGVAALLALAACSSGGTSSSSGKASSSGTVTVAVVSNPLITGQMIPLTTSSFEKQYPGITVKFAPTPRVTCGRRSRRTSARTATRSTSS